MNDITYCTFEECCKLDCKRHWANAPKDEYIWLGEFQDCEYWEEH